METEETEQLKSWMPETLIISILSCPCICTLPISLVGVYYSSKVDAYLARGQLKMAHRYAKVAFVLVLTSGLLTFGLYLVLLILIIRLSGPF